MWTEHDISTWVEEAMFYATQRNVHGKLLNQNNSCSKYLIRTKNYYSSAN